MRKTTFFKIFLGISIIFCAAQNVFALSDINSSGDMIATISPLFPGPNTSVKINIRSMNADLSTSQITWDLNGKTVQKGQAKTDFVFMTGEIGKKITLVITAQEEGGQTIKKTISMIPAAVDLMWEADTYTPPLYRGKALPSTDSNIRVYALPNFVSENGVKIDPKNLNYKWRENSSDAAQFSGFGKQTMTTTGAIPMGKSSISVAVTSSDGSIRAESYLDIPSVSPFIAFYNENPLEGTSYDTGNVTTLDLRGTEATIRAEPFYFSTEDKQNSQTYSWTLNGSPTTPDSENPQLITLRKESQDIVGKATVGLSIKSLDKLFQEARSTLVVNLGNK
jgi:hypothetical protein